MTQFDEAFARQMSDVVLPRRGLLTLGFAVAIAGCASAGAGTLRGPIISAGPDFERIKRIGNAVLTPPNGTTAWTFGVVPDEASKSAFVYGPSGIQISKGLLTACENDGQIAASLIYAASINGPRRSNLPNFDRDLLTIRTLARTGYDPRDALVIARRMPASTHQPDPQAPRWAAMEAELRKLGYQV